MVTQQHMRFFFNPCFPKFFFPLFSKKKKSWTSIFIHLQGLYLPLFPQLLKHSSSTRFFSLSFPLLISILSLDGMIGFCCCNYHVYLMTPKYIYIFNLDLFTELCTCISSGLTILIHANLDGRHINTINITPKIDVLTFHTQICSLVFSI